MKIEDQKAKLARIEARIATAMEQGSPVIFLPRECTLLMGLVRLGQQGLDTLEALSRAGLRELEGIKRDSPNKMSEETKAGLRELDAREHAATHSPRGFNG